VAASSIGAAAAAGAAAGAKAAVSHPTGDSGADASPAPAPAAKPSPAARGSSGQSQRNPQAAARVGSSSRAKAGPAARAPAPAPAKAQAAPARAAGGGKGKPSASTRGSGKTAPAAAPKRQAAPLVHNFALPLAHNPASTKPQSTAERALHEAAWDSSNSVPGRAPWAWQREPSEPLPNPRHKPSVGPALVPERTALAKAIARVPQMSSKPYMARANEDLAWQQKQHLNERLHSLVKHDARFAKFKDKLPGIEQLAYYEDADALWRTLNETTRMVKDDKGRVVDSEAFLSKSGRAALEAEREPRWRQTLLKQIDLQRDEAKWNRQVWTEATKSAAPFVMLSVIDIPGTLLRNAETTGWFDAREKELVRLREQVSRGDVSVAQGREQLDRLYRLYADRRNDVVQSHGHNAEVHAIAPRVLEDGLPSVGAMALGGGPQGFLYSLLLRQGQDVAAWAANAWNPELARHAPAPNLRSLTHNVNSALSDAVAGKVLKVAGPAVKGGAFSFGRKAITSQARITGNTFGLSGLAATPNALMRPVIDHLFDGQARRESEAQRRAEAPQALQAQRQELYEQSQQRVRSDAVRFENRKQEILAEARTLKLSEPQIAKLAAELEAERAPIGLESRMAVAFDGYRAHQALNQAFKSQAAQAEKLDQKANEQLGSNLRDVLVRQAISLPVSYASGALTTLQPRAPVPDELAPQQALAATPKVWLADAAHGGLSGAVDESAHSLVTTGRLPDGRVARAAVGG
jgi:hypothetical protein